MQIYLDTNIICTTHNYGSDSQESRTLLTMLGLPNVEKFTSRKSLEEINKTKDELIRLRLLEQYDLVNKINWRALESNFGISAHPIGGAPFCGGVTDSLFSNLSSVFDHDDAMHIFQAIRGKCDYFITNDRRTILDRVKLNRDRVLAMAGGMTFLSPGDFVKLYGVI